MIRKLINWLDQRLPLPEVRAYFLKKSVPVHRHSIWYYFGGLTLTFLAVQIVTGILLTFYYKPTPEGAHESIIVITNEVPFGWLIRSLHEWAANLTIGSLFVHMFSTFLMKAYRKPREVMWITGVLLLFLVLGFGFTGYLLPWDTVAYFATLIGTEVPATLPVVGDWGVNLLKGGIEVGGETLTRMYSLHVIILPMVTLVVVSLHLLLNQVFGSSIPLGTTISKPPIRFFPNFLYRDFISWIIGLIVLLLLATAYPGDLGEKADPLASAPFGIKPEWYFLPLYQSLKIVPSTILTLSGELIVNLLVMIGSAFWLVVPFIDRRASRGQKSLPFTILGICLILYLVITIILAYATT
jgi:cytochrome b6